MRIKGWECVVSPEGSTRAVSHKEDGNCVFINGRLVGHCDMPPEVFQWLIRPMLSESWQDGYNNGWTSAPDRNPFDGELPNKDKEPS